MLHVIDSQWKDHLLSMDHMKEGIGLRGYGQRDPLTEYKREAYDLFEEMVDRVRTTVDRAPLQDAGRARGGSGARAPAGADAARAAAARAGGAGVAPLARRRPSGGPRRRAERAEGRPQRCLPLRLREEVQEVLSRQGRLRARPRI